VRCSRHDLACGPDGRCVLCRRNSSRPSRRVAPPSLRPPPSRARPWLVAATLIAPAVSLAAWSLSGPARSRPREIIALLPAAPAPPQGGPLSATALAAESSPPPSLPPTDPAEDPRLSALLAIADDAAAAPFGRSHVVVYTTSWCPACRQTKAWLRANGVPYEERDIEASRTYAMQMRALNPRMSIPTIDVEGDVDVGFSTSWLTTTLRKHGMTLGP